MKNNSKNIQFPYKQYKGHFCLGIIYDRLDTSIDETETHNVKDLRSITSVISNIQLFVAEKWKIASDKGGSGNTANIGSIKNIEDIVNGKGVFSKLGESWFDDYWINYNKATIINQKGETKKVKDIEDFVQYKRGETSLIVPKR